MIDWELLTTIAEIVLCVVLVAVAIIIRDDNGGFKK